jgi:hypothetical protein
MSNKRVLSKVDLGKYKKSNPYSKDIIVDPRGQWDNPGEVTRIPGNDITMQGVDYPVWAQPNIGMPQMMYPDQDYNFPEADYVDEFPQMQEAKQGGALLTQTMTCGNCGWKWKAADGGSDVTTCHKCGGKALPIAQKGKSVSNIDKEQIYTYSKRPNSEYTKDTSGKWLIKNESTNGKFISINDPKGSRAKILNAQAVPTNTYNINGGKWQVNNDVWTQVADNALVNNAHTRDRESAYTKGKSERLFKNITPQSYGDLALNLDRYKRYQKNSGRNKNELLWYGAKDSPTGKATYSTIPRRDDMFSLYLGLPQKNKSFEPQLIYRPTNEKNSNSLYHKPTYWTEKGKQELLDNYFLMNDYTKGIFNERNTILEPIYDSLSQTGLHHSDPQFGSAVMDNPLGDFTVTEGKDKNGNYISIYDKIDFNPFETGEGSSINPKALALKLYMKSMGYDVDEGTEGSSLLGAGKPYEIYDRIYYDEKTNKVKKYKQGGESDYYEDDLDEAQIEELRAQGYTVEELPKAQKGITISDPKEQRAVKPEDLKEYNLNTGSYLQDGGKTDAMTGMMKARLAYANEFGNPAAKRMINIPDNPYQFDNGDIGTHYMASYDNYAVPQIQDENGELVLGDYGPESNEAIKFDSDEDANYFAKHYKDVSPAFINAELTDHEIQEYIDGGYIVEELPIAKDGGEHKYYTVKGSSGVYRKVNNKWEVDFNKSGNFQPLSKGDVAKRSAVLNKQAKQMFDPMYDEIIETKKAGYKSTPKQETKQKAKSLQQKVFNKDFKVTSPSEYEQVEAQIKQQQDDYKQSANPTKEGLAAIEKMVWNANGVGPQGLKPHTVREAIPQSNASRAWDYITNPFTAFEYSVSGGGAENMPHNINAARMAGMDPGVVPGRNLIGNALNSTLNLFDAGDKVIRNVGEGNYGTAALEALRFLPGSRVATGLGNKLAETPLRNAWRLNPKAYQYNLPENTMWRGLGQEGMEDAVSSGLLRSKQNVAAEFFPGSTLRMDKSFGTNPYFTPKFKTASTYGDNFLAEVPKDAANWRNRYVRTDWSQVADKPIPIDEGRLLQKDWWQGYKPIEVPKQLNNNTKIPFAKTDELGANVLKNKKYPTGEITEKEKELLTLKLNQKPFNTKAFAYLKNPLYVQETNRGAINQVLYGGKELSKFDKFLLRATPVAGTSMIGYLSADRLLEDPYKNAINRKVGSRLFKTGLTDDPSSTYRDTTINLNNNYVDFARVNETADGETILGGDFISNNNNTVRTAEEWVTTKDKTYGDNGKGFRGDKSKIKDIKSFYGVENGELKVGSASDFNSETVIVPNRYDDGRKISNARVEDGYLRIVDKNNKPIYQNVQGFGKMILYSDKTKKSQFISFEKPETGVKQINAFIKENPDAIPIILDNGRYRTYMHNKKGLTDENFQNYYSVDEFREGKPGYNLVLKNKKENGEDIIEDEMQNGGEFIEMELTDKEIQQHIDRGYVIEEVPEYAPGGVVDMNPAIMAKYLAELKLQENAGKVGFKNGKFYPHASAEKGKDTIGYGHKLTGKNDKYYYQGLTPKQVEDLTIKDILSKQASAKKHVDDIYGQNTFDKLPQESQMLLTDYQYNVGLSKFPKFLDATVKGDKAGMLDEYERSYSGGKLKKRNDWTKGVITNIDYTPKKKCKPKAKISKPVKKEYGLPYKEAKLIKFTT